MGGRAVDRIYGGELGMLLMEGVEVEWERLSMLLGGLGWMSL